MKITNKPAYIKAIIFHKLGHDVLANLFLRSAYGVK